MSLFLNLPSELGMLIIGHVLDAPLSPPRAPFESDGITR
ncbi:hypothetical protein PDIG_17420 [Penicillium digitatum PHI26]|uniref:Uncharacterized protein n=2 Tax=Penicillium digitatum TaxID=36651 RepID=K9GQT4_PEND2|nr:hypothetical protein PDIP_55310 [Penicillium digitatum Pd1]EKV11641.1 hypothetical protein PDIP_55310 [Penicillium digitatum Pd1]EKV17028.1 hypothetical protein PDIG_17420 [Penicillium digitatum PHI26]